MRAECLPDGHVQRRAQVALTVLEVDAAFREAQDGYGRRVRRTQDARIVRRDLFDESHRQVEIAVVADLKRQRHARVPAAVRVVQHRGGRQRFVGDDRLDADRILAQAAQVAGAPRRAWLI